LIIVYQKALLTCFYTKFTIKIFFVNNIQYQKNSMVFILPKLPLTSSPLLSFFFHSCHYFIFFFRSNIASIKQFSQIYHPGIELGHLLFLSLVMHPTRSPQVWRIVEPIIHRLSQVLSRDACGSRKFLDLPSVRAATRWAQTPPDGLNIYYLDEIINQIYFIMMRLYIKYILSWWNKDILRTRQHFSKKEEKHLRAIKEGNRDDCVRFKFFSLL